MTPRPDTGSSDASADERPRRADTPKGRAARAAIVAAVWEALEEADLAQLPAGLSVRRVAAAAGVSPGGVQYHFPTMRDLGEAMVDSVLSGLAPDPIDVVTGSIEAAPTEGMAAAVRAAAQLNWDVLGTPEERAYDRRLQRVIALAHGSEPVAAALRRRLREDYWGSFRPAFEQTIRSMLTASDRRMVEPFTVEDLAVVLGALAEGMRVQQTCFEGAIRDDLYADAVVALTTAVTAPVGRPRSVSELAVELERNRRNRERSDDDLAALVAVAHAAAPLFADGVEDVGFAAIVDAAGGDVALAEVVETFGEPRRVAAVSFGRHLDELRDAASRRRDASPDVALADLVLAIARCAQAEPWAAVALLQERAEAAARPTSVAPIDVRSLVPLDALVADAVAAARPALPEGEVVAVAELVVDATLSHASARPSAALSRLVTRVLRLVPPDG